MPRTRRRRGGAPRATCSDFLRGPVRAVLAGVPPTSSSCSRYARANVDPSDRYVQSLPGTGAWRLRRRRVRYGNLFLAGDWIDCGLNAGCIEAAVLSGLEAANARSRTGR